MEKNIIRLSITGMTCAACSASVERVLRKKDGVESAVVNLATNTASIYARDDIDVETLIKAIEKAGFNASLAKDSMEQESFRIKNGQIAVALIFGALELYVGMSHMLPIRFPLPSIISDIENPLNFALIQLILTIPVLIAGHKFFTSGFKKLFALHPNMDSLVAIGTGSAFIYSIVNTVRAFMGDLHAVHNLYYESAAVVLALVLLGKFLEERSKKAAKKALTALASMVSDTATIEIDGIEKEVPANKVKKGDIVVAKPGWRIAVDGIIISGEASVDEAALTGESLPVFKTVDSTVFGGTICSDGYLKIKATGVGADTAISNVLRLVLQAQERKAPAARLADKISAVFVPVVMALAVVCALAWLIAGQSFNFAINIFVSVLVVACPCSLGLATPIAVMAGSGRGANLGILFRGGDVMEQSAKINTVFFDKTGTITEGKLTVDAVAPIGISSNELLHLTASLEKGSEHPIARAIVSHAEEKSITLAEPMDLIAVAGRGVKAQIDGKIIVAGTALFMENENITLADTEKTKIPDGCTAVFLGIDGKYSGYIALSDTIRQDSAHGIARLNALGVQTIMLTGDNKGSAQRIAKQAGISKVIAEVLPEQKLTAIEDEKQKGNIVAMVGDGVNDAPALATAHVGIAVQNATDAAAESAGVILMRHDLNAVAESIILARATLRIIRENLFWAFFYNTVGIPLAAGLLFIFGGPLLTPAFAGAAMALSSVSVVTNSLRLTNYNVNKHK